MTDVVFSEKDRTIVRKFLAEIGQSAIGPYHPLSKAVAVADGLANRLCRAHVMRNDNPDMAREHLIGAFATWPLLCRVMAELEEAYPLHAAQGRTEAEWLLDFLDRRDGKGAYA